MKLLNSKANVINVNNFLFISLIITTLTISIFDIIGVSLVLLYLKLILNLNNEILIFGFKINSNINLLIKLSIILSTIYIIKFFITIYLNYKIFSSSQILLTKLRIKLLNSILNSNTYNYNVEYNNINTISEKYIHDFFLVKLKLISDLIIISILLIFILFWNPFLIITLFLIISLIIYIYDKIFSLKLEKLGVESNNSKKLISTYSEYIMKSFKEFSLLNKNSFFMNKFEESSAKFGNSYSLTQLLSSAPKYLLELIISLSIFLVALVELIINPNPSDVFVELGVLVFIVFRIMPIIYSLSQSILYLRNSSDSYALLEASLSRTSKNSKQSIIKCSNGPIFKALISINNIDFAYSKNYIFKNANFEISLGEMVGVYAPSGKGKSTLIEIILGYLKPQSANYFVDGDKLSNDEFILFLRDNAAYIPQSSFIFEGSLFENVTLEHNRDQATNVRFLKALELVGLLNSGIEILDHLGSNVSGGQRQRISLARALYHDKKFLVLDEPTSSLDADSSLSIFLLLKKLRTLGKAILVISHDSQLIDYADYYYEILNYKLVKIRK